MLGIRLPLLFIASIFAPTPSLSRSPYALRISCGARADIRTEPTNTLWFKDFAYTGGVPGNASRTSFITPNLPTLRYFPTSDGPENCYDLNRVPYGHYLVRVYLGLLSNPSFNSEPLFDVSIEGTLVYSVPTGWSRRDDEGAFVEALVFLTRGTGSICFHSTGHGSPSVLAIELLQIDDRAYYFGQGFGQGTVLRTVARVSFGSDKPKFGSDYGGDTWGGDRFWDGKVSFELGSSLDRAVSTKDAIDAASRAPNFYPEGLYKTAIVGSDLVYTVDVEPARNYSLWLHFAEIDPSVTGPGERVFDVVINGDVAIGDVDVVGMAGSVNTALVLNTTVSVSGRSLTVGLRPAKGDRAIIGAIEVLEIIQAEPKTLSDEVRALHKLREALALPLRLGWNGDPCVPEQHPWSGVDCRYDKNISKHVIDGLGLDNQGLSGFLPNDILGLSHLQSINLSGNSISGAIPSSLGNISGLEILDLSYNFFNGSIPESLGQLTSLRILDLNGNSLSGRVPPALGGRLLHGASFNFTDNSGVCGIPGLPSCGTHLSPGAKFGIMLGSFVTFLLMAICFMCLWKRRQNILRAQRIAARSAPYAKARTHPNRDVQMTRHSGHESSRTAAENGPSLLA